MKKSLGLWNFFTIGFGAIIGTGWVLLVGDWMQLGGGPVPAMIAFVIGALFLLPMGAVFGELTAAIPIAGGTVEYVARTFGDKASFATAWFLALGNGIICPWEAIAIANLAGEFIPALKTMPLYSVMGATVYLPTMLIGMAAAGYVIYLNFKGASSAAKLQSFMTNLLLGGMVVAMGIAFVKGSPSHLQPLVSLQDGSSNLWMGILPVLVMTPFFYAGFDTIPQQAEEAAEGLDWNKFGKVISMALLAAGVFYMVCIYAFGTMVPWQDFVTYNIPALTILGVIGLPLFGKFMMFVALCGPLGPMNSFFGATTRVMLAMSRKQQLPASFGKLHPTYKTPTTANILMAALTLAGPLLGPKMLVPLTNVSALAFIFACFMVACACFKMRNTEPELKRPYKVPGGKLGIGAACAAGAIIIGLLVVPGSPAALKPAEWAIVVGWAAIGLIFAAVQSKNKGKAQETEEQSAA